MRSKPKGIALFLIAVMLLLIGKKDFLTALIEEWRDRRKAIPDAAVSQQGLMFERQTIIYDSGQAGFKNAVLYFEVVRPGQMEFSKYSNTIKKTEDGAMAESASESN